MQKKHTLLIAAAVHGLLAGLSAPQVLADSKDDKIDALEKRLRDLERRLEKSADKELTPTARLAQEENNATVKAIDQKVKILERKLEVDKEVADSAKKSAAKIEAGPDTGFRITSADGQHQLRLRGFVQADGDFFMDDSIQGADGIGLNSSTGKPNRIQDGYGLGVDKFWIRRARLQFAGTLFKNIDFLVAPDFAQGQARLFDAWADLHYLPFASLSVGKQKGPVSLERIQGAPNLLFAERAYPTLLAPNRDIGVMLHGEFDLPGYESKYAGPISTQSGGKELFSYQVGVFNGTRDNQAVQNSDNATFDNKDFEGRVFSHPFVHSGIDALSGLGVGIAGTYGNPTRQSPIPNLVSPGQNTILSYATGGTQNGTVKSSSQSTTAGDTTTKVTTTVTPSSTFSAALSDGTSYRIYPQGYWYWGPFGLLGEYASSSQDLAVQETDNQQTTVKTDVTTKGDPVTQTTNRSSTVSSRPRTVHSVRQDSRAWQIAASYVLTGEDNGFNGVKPRHAFDPFAGQWGALQVAARWSELDIDGDTFRNFGTADKPSYLYADPRSSVQHASSWALGLNWYLNQNFKIMTDFEQTQFDGGAVRADKKVTDRPDEKVFITRFQFSY